MHSAFLLLDNIFSASDIDAFALILQNSYIGKHRDQSEAKQLDHSSLWNSITIWDDWNKMVFYLVNLLKDKDTFHSLSTVKSVEYQPGKLLTQKISNTCQQYALYITLTIVDEIGLFPNIPGADWKAVGDRIKFEDYNVFSFLLSLFQVAAGRNKKKSLSKKLKRDDGFIAEDESLSADVGGESNEEIIPYQIFLDEVLSTYLVPMYTFAMKLEAEERNVTNKDDKKGNEDDKKGNEDDTKENEEDEDNEDEAEVEADLPRQIPLTYNAAEADFLRQIPLTYNDFCSKQFNKKVIDCFNKLKELFPGHTKKYHAKLLNEQNGLKLTKIKMKPKGSKSETMHPFRNAWILRVLSSHESSLFSGAQLAAYRERF
jgi:hypothetical protein